MLKTEGIIMENSINEGALESEGGDATFQSTSDANANVEVNSRESSLKGMSRPRRGMTSTSSLAEEAVDQLHANEKLIAGINPDIITNYNSSTE
jgi:hypothetical protein